MMRTLLLHHTAAAVLLLVAVAPAAAQDPICPGLLRPGVDLADAAAVQLRAAQLAGQAPLRSLTIRRPSLERKVPLCVAAADTTGTAPQERVDLLPVRMRTLYNSAYPLNVNTGALWAGAGASASLEAGLEFRRGPLTAALYPLVAYQHNSDFPMRQVEGRQTPPYRYAGHQHIDWPQRHGSDPFWTLHPGQSMAQLAAGGAALGVSTENLWIGPAQRMPLMMSSTAPGFPHLYIGTERAIRTPVGGVEALLLWGLLRESRYHDNDPDNDRSFLVGTTAVWEPIFLPGLFLGLHRSYLERFGTPEWGFVDYLVRPFVDLTGNPATDNKLLSVFARWALPEAEFEVYGEWAREDGWGEWVDLLREADHSQAFMLGFQKLTRAGDARLRWWGELANLQHSLTVRGGRGTQTLYVHTYLTQGYTNRGQLLGAWIGPGSSSQIVGLERIRGDRTMGLALERVRYDADAYYNQWARFYGETGHDASIALWLRWNETLADRLHLAATASVGRRQNRNFVYFTGEQPADLRWETNGHVDVQLRWQPRR